MSSNTIVRGVGAVIDAATAGASLVACGSSEEGETLTFAAVPSESSNSLSSSFENITNLLEQETGATVKFQSATDYASVIEGMRAGQIDVAFFCSTPRASTSSTSSR